MYISNTRPVVFAVLGCSWFSLSLSIAFSSTLFSREAFASPRALTHYQSDFDGDGKSDLVVFDPTTATFKIRFSSNMSVVTHEVGHSGNQPVTGDFASTGLSALASFNRSTAEWNFKIYKTKKFDEFALAFGSPGDIAVPARFNGNTCTDLAVFDRQTRNWTVANCKQAKVRKFKLGKGGAIPVVDNYDGDSRDDLATYDRPSGEWTILLSSTNKSKKLICGLPGDIPVPGDYDGDGRAEAAIYRHSLKSFLICDEDGTVKARPFGLIGDRMLVRDIEGDGIVDLMAYRPKDRKFFISTSSLVPFEIPLSSERSATDAVSMPLGATEIRYRAVKGDFNRDNSSDIVLLTEKDGLLYWDPRTIKGDPIPLAAPSFGLPTDTPLLTDRDGDYVVNPTVLREGADGYLRWYSAGISGASETLFGLKGDSPVAGDFDCDGKDDLAVVRSIGSELRWFVRGSANFNSENAGIPWGLTGDQPFAADMNGDGCDELIVTRKDAASGGLWWFTFNTQNSATSQFQWGIANYDVPTTPVDLNGDGLDDPLVIRHLGANKTAYAWLGGTKHQSYLLGQDTQPFLGYFDGLLLAQFADFIPKSSSVAKARILVYSSQGAKTITLDDQVLQVLTPSGNRIVVSAPKPSKTTDKDSEEDDTSGGSASNQCLRTGGPTSFVDGAGNGSLWKPIAEGTPYRAPVILLPKSYDGAKISLYGADGTDLSGTARTDCCPNGGRAHFWLKTSTSVLSKHAPITVKISKGSTTECRLVPSPGKRYD